MPIPSARTEEWLRQIQPQRNARSVSARFRSLPSAAPFALAQLVLRLARPSSSAITRQGKNRENYRGSFEFDFEIVEFCPESANLAEDQGINSEFCGFLCKTTIKKAISVALR